MINAKEAGKRTAEVRGEVEKYKRQEVERWMEKYCLEAIILDACEKGLSKITVNTRTCPYTDILIQILEGLGYEVRITLVGRNDEIKGISVRWSERY